MALEKICAPVLLYLGFSIIQIIIDTFKNLYNTAFLKFIVMIIFSFILNLLCNLNLTPIAWLLVFIPFIFMTFITTILLFVFGLSPDKGSVSYQLKNDILIPIEEDISAVRHILPGVPTPIPICNQIFDISTCTTNSCYWNPLGGYDQLGNCEESPYIFSNQTSITKKVGLSPVSKQIIIPDLPIQSSTKIVQDNELCYFKCLVNNPDLNNDNILNISPSLLNCKKSCG